MTDAIALIDRLAQQHSLTLAEYQTLIEAECEETRTYAAQQAVAVRQAVYGTDIFLRGLIEVTSYCRNDCYYCGIRRSNQNCDRYRLSDEDILACCAEGYQLGFRTFVLQGGEDGAFSVPRVCRLIRTIKSDYPDCAVTLSLGEMARADYQALYDAGADRYLLRHETADPDHYAALHPAALSIDHRIQCLRDLKDIGYQVGCGFLVGSPGQTPELLAKDLKFVEEIQPAMCGIGPFIPQQDTPLRDEAPGTAELTVNDAAEAAKFEHVTFTYKDAGAPSLTDITFTARSGETIGVIGGTGSGKSTLIDLVCRFYDADNGGVALFGHDVKQYSFAQLRRLVGVVPQQAVLFTGTIRDNMQWAAPGASDEEIWQALEIAQAAEFVRGKPGMLDAPVETAGRNFSGGQRQRLTIARALVPKPKILILDDSASALDFATDAALRKAIKEETHGMTVFIVSQRAASVQRADHILVLDDGKLVGDAPHAELLRSCEVYKEICLSQLSKEEVAKTL